jgi:hypothetical protein
MVALNRNSKQNRLQAILKMPLNIKDQMAYEWRVMRYLKYLLYQNKKAITKVMAFITLTLLLVAVFA